MANNKIQIKRSVSNSTVTGLSNGELAFTANGNILYIGNPADGASVRIAGLQVPGTLTANQALVANSTSGIDKVITGNLVTQQIYANGSHGTGGQVLITGGSSSNVYWAPVGSVGGVNTDAQYTFTNTIAFTSNVLANTVNATAFTTSGVTTNTSGVYTTGTVNGATISVGTSFVANSSTVRIANTVGLQANGTTGTAGQVLTSNGTTVYWTTPTTGDITAVTAGAGLTGGGTAGDVSIDVGSGNGISVSADAIAVIANSGLVANATGVHIVTSGDSTLIANSTGLYVNDATLSILSSQISGDIALGTQTSGSYVATITAGNGLTGDATGEGSTPTLAVGAGNGITVAADAVAVLANSGLVANATGVHIVTSGDSTLIANSTGLYVNDATISIATSQLSGDVALGTQTSGNYVASVAAANGIAGAVAAAEGTAPSLYIVANNGIVANSTGVWAKAANGTSVDAAGINVVGGNGLVANASGVHVGAGNGVSVSADAVAVTGGSTLTVNATGVHVNNTLSITDLSLSGNLTVLGTLSTIDTTNLTVKDSLIELANGNTTTDLLDIGLYGQYGATGTRFTGIFRDASDGVYKLFANSTVEPTTVVDTAATGYIPATLQAFLQSGGLVSNGTNIAITANSTLAVAITANTLTLTTALAGTSGGTGKSTMTSQAILVGNTTNGYNELTLGTSGFVLQSNGSALVYDSLDGGVF